MSHTVHEDGGKAGLLDGIVGNKLDPHLVSSGLDVLWYVVAAIDTNEWASRVMTVPDLQIVVDAVVVVLDLKRLELESHLVIGWHRDPPSALLIGLIIVREVG